MTSTVAKVTELTAKSDKSFDDAINIALKRASKTIRNITSAWVKEQRIEVSAGRISAYQVNLLVTFVLDE